MNELHAPGLPLTTAQRGLWVGQKLASAEATLNIAEAVEIHGPVEPALFQRALRQFADEAEAVRARIVEHNGLPYQIVRERYEFDTPYIDFSAEPDPRAAADAWMQAEINRPVDLAHDPLWVGAIFKFADDLYCWYQRAHHTVYDGYSGGMAAKRLNELYCAYRDGVEPEPCGYGTLASLVEAEASYRDSDRYRRDREYWLEQLAGLPEAVTLARRRVRNNGGLRRSSGHVPEAGRERLAQIARDNGVSLPQVLIALIAAYYHRASGAHDLVFGMPVTGRASHALRSTPGMVANVVAIRLQMRADMSMSELFQQTSRTVKSALRHQQYRFEELRRDLGLVNPDQHMAWLGINIEPYDYNNFLGHRGSARNLHNGTAEDLTVFVFDRLDGQGLSFDFDANPTLYPAAELDEHKRRLMRLIDAVLETPDIALGAIDVLGADERVRLLTQWNDTDAPLRDTTALAEFRRQADASPDAVALVAGTSRLSYRELDESSTRLARRLVARGVRPGDTVAIALPRDEVLLSALLAVWKAGAAYLPLDPDAPMQRIALTLDDAAPSLLLTAPAFADAFAGRGLPLLFAHAQDERYDAQAADAPELPEAGGDHGAYVIYTSGSTGVPKGVEVGQRSFWNFLQAMQRELQPEPGQRYLAQTTITFDIAGLELFLPLTVGATVVLTTAEIARNPLALARLIDEQRIDAMQATPSLWRMLLANSDVRLQRVHALIGGEALSPELAAQLVRQARRLTNLYGPTETTVWSTAMEIDAQVLAAGDGAPPPIGRPLLNTQVYVLDAAGQPMPTGSVGELYIGGAGVARGYRNRDLLNAERFLPDPFRPGGRLYRTGDLARWRDDGTLEYLGRADQQVKIRGHRVELGEIETQLRGFDVVAEAAVALHRDAAGNALLTAYVVPAAGADAVPDALRRALAARLPDYMVPAAWIELAALPMTPSGKLDRKALRPPERSRQSAYVAPRTEAERKLATIWQRIFKLERVGIHDNFFELGGDSLTAAELVAALPRHFGSELSMGALFEGSTIAGLAAALERSGGDNDPLGALLALRGGAQERGGAQDRPAQERPLFCIHPVTGVGWAFTGMLRQLELPLYALQSRGLRGGALPGSIEEVAADYIAQMRKVQPHGPYRLLGWSLGGLIGHAVAAQLQREGDRVELLAMMDSYPFATEPATPDEAQQAQAVLKFLGFHHRLREAPQDMRALTELLCQEYEVFSNPLVQQVLKDDAKLIEHVAAVTRNNLSLARRYMPQRIDADVLFFDARRKERVDLDGLLHYRANAWQAHVAGRFEVHEVDCHHQTMLEPRAAAHIGRVLRERLHGAPAQPARADAPPPAALTAAAALVAAYS
ncbi:non-ribosomal peptide synthetase [Lysobacter enzymogenes]|uniref:Amino acid adenylation domain-containing protein n=1 Tax=Lysobacter enzymogenes TaxID=69 RepID=A0A3N2RLQ4_LYSEN|nr:non-ribosomal peptide synthetase [Lysobacter enzymogenes]ROU08276.1 amino acid adenylation domain-containing protein [Lysobacter enzymogenes]